MAMYEGGAQGSQFSPSLKSVDPNSSARSINSLCGFDYRANDTPSHTPEVNDNVNQDGNNEEP